MVRNSSQLTSQNTNSPRQEQANTDPNQFETIHEFNTRILAAIEQIKNIDVRRNKYAEMISQALLAKSRSFKRDFMTDLYEKAKSSVCLLDFDQVKTLDTFIIMGEVCKAVTVPGGQSQPHRVHVSANTENNAQHNETVNEFDSRISSTLPQLIKGKEKTYKENYLQAVAREIVGKSPEFKKAFALFILNSPSHILKQERHFFRSQKYSNETLSVHKLVASLLKNQVQIVNNKVVIDDNHTLSRHADECFKKS
ncbi:hypothetical protein ACFORL_12740 [Legionella dresdenensis]|uniref:Substrate of the Dot/Icm secretion system n=1 Tax=Legionella dresdenensis TaxID=450200 RepID=A0ABV8CIV3_9GAMM